MGCNASGGRSSGQRAAATAVDDRRALIDVIQEPALLLVRAARGYRVVHANPAASRALEVAPAKLASQGLTTSVPADTAAALLALCDAAAGADGPVRRCATAPDPLTDLGTCASITVRVSQWGGQLLCTWLPTPEADETTGIAAGAPVADRLLLADALNTLTGTGRGIFTIDLTTGRVVWSAEMYAIFARDHAAGPIEVADARDHVVSDVPLRLPWLALIRDGAPLDFEVNQHRAPGPRRLRIRLRTAGQVDGRPAWVHGDCRILAD